MTYLCSKGHRVNAQGSDNIDSLCRICKRQAREAQWRFNPFYAGTFYGGPTYHVDATSRIERVARFDTGQCWRALRVPGLQKTVRTAIERRLRKLEVSR
jgi:hypothetical protein